LCRSARSSSSRDGALCIWSSSDDEHLPQPPPGAPIVAAWAGEDALARQHACQESVGGSKLIALAVAQVDRRELLGRIGVTPEPEPEFLLVRRLGWCIRRLPLA